MKPRWIIPIALFWIGNQTQVVTPSDIRTSAIGGAVYYVAPAGDDSNPGTEIQPWRTIQKAADALVSGETVYIKAGIYSERLIPQNSGSADNYIVYSAYPGDEVTIDGASFDIPEWGGLVDITQKAYIRISGFTVMNSGPTLHNPGISVDESNHIIIEKNYVSNSSDSGVAVWSSYHVIVESNIVEGACYNGYNESISIGGTDDFEVRYNQVHGGQKEGICTKDGSSNGKVYGNEVDRTGAVGLYIDAEDKHTYNIDVYGNTVRDSVENGISLASEQGGLLENIRVYNNIAYDNTWVGLHIMICCSDNHPMSNIQIVNNTFYNNGREPWGGGIAHDNPQATGVVIRNNLCSQNLSFQIIVSSEGPSSSFIVDHNLIDGFRGEAGESYGGDYVEGNPQFVNPAGADFHLQKDSPAIDKGSSTDAPAEDFEGSIRPSGGADDIGAYEYIFSTGVDFFSFY